MFSDADEVICIFTSLYVKQRLNFRHAKSEVNPFNRLFYVDVDLIEKKKDNNNRRTVVLKWCK